MGLQGIPAYGSVLSHPVTLDRNILRGLSGSRSGAIRYGDFAVAPTATTRQFSVGPGRAYIHGQENSQQGGYYAWSDASENLVVAAPSASPRIDTLLARVWDSDYGTLSSGITRIQWDIVQGVPGASPTSRPNSDFLFGGSQYVPGAWWRVVDIRSNPGDTTIPAGQIFHPLTTVQATLPLNARYPGSSGKLIIPDKTFRPTDALYGEEVKQVDTDVEYWFDGSVWIPKAGQTIHEWVRGPANAANTKLLTAVTGNTVAYTTPALAVEPNMLYTVTWSFMMSSGVGGTHFFKSYLYVGGVNKGRSGEFAYTGGNVAQRSSGVKMPYITGGAETSTTFELRTDDGLAAAYDVAADPDQQAYVHVESTGRKVGKFST
jgi:hypothetical protein